MANTQDPQDAPVKEFQSVTAPICPGCGQTFRPSRKNQRHCRPSCRVLALRGRRAGQALKARALFE